MFWFLFYLGITYGLVLAVWGACFYVSSRKKWQRRWLAVPAVLLLPLPLLPYAQVAWQTQQHRDELLPAFMKEARHTISGELTTPPLVFRVLEFTPRRAVVYAEERCVLEDTDGRSGWTMTLKKRERGWEFSDYDAVWSDCGSAEGNTFPPYPGARSF